MISELIMLDHYAKRLNKDRVFNFKYGVNIIAGPNGSGKSTIIECLRKEVFISVKKDEWGQKLKDQTRFAIYKEE